MAGIGSMRENRSRVGRLALGAWLLMKAALGMAGSVAGMRAGGGAAAAEPMREIVLSDRGGVSDIRYA